MDRMRTGYPFRMATSRPSHSPHSPLQGASPVEARTALLKRAARDAMDYLEGVNDRPVAPTPSAVAALSALRGPLPPGPTSPEAVLHLLNEYGSPATVAMGGGRYFGFVNGGCVPAAQAAAWLVSAWDQNSDFLCNRPRPSRSKRSPLNGSGNCSACRRAPAARS